MKEPMSDEKVLALFAAGVLVGILALVYINSQSREVYLQPTPLFAPTYPVRQPTDVNYQMMMLRVERHSETEMRRAKDPNEPYYRR